MPGADLSGNLDAYQAGNAPVSASSTVMAGAIFTS